MIITVPNGKILIRKVYKTNILNYIDGKEVIKPNAAIMVAYTHVCYQGLWDFVNNIPIKNSNRINMSLHIDNFLFGIKGNIKTRLQLMNLIENK